MSTIWAFDLGKGSIGEAVWNVGKKQFEHVASLLIPAEFASTKEAASRRRMLRTRQAHKAREAWLDEVWKEAGLEPLVGRRVGKVDGKWRLVHKGDERLEREFPKKGDATCYTSCLLRIKLLRGEKLEEWQIYKGLHSAIQKRGYDPDVAWKTRENRRTRKGDQDDDETGTAERMAAFEMELAEMSPDKEDYRLSCYFDAWKMGLWSPGNPAELKDRIDHSAQSTRNRILPRRLVEREIRLLVEAAGKQIPALAGKEWYVMYGPAGRAYASFYKAEREEFQLREGGATDWQGVLGQKIPRFDNRIIEKCALIPRFNVCKVRSDELRAKGERGTLPQEVTFLMKLKNMRVQRTPALQTGLNAEEIAQVFGAFSDKGWKLTETQWRKFCASIGASPVPPSLEVEAPKLGGRSRLCRPALDILKRLILSGQSPHDFHAAECQRLNDNTDPRKGLVATDLKFLVDMGSAWEGIHIPNQKLDALAQRTRDSGAAILELIGSQNDPIVRHRLGAFWKRIKELESTHGLPDEIAIEFVREDFMGPKALLDYRKFIKDREKDRKQARADAEAAGSNERSAGLKMELLRLQAGVCLYTGAPLATSSLEEYEVDHIVPRSQGGPDSMVNYILTTKKANDEKGNQTPFEWLSATDGWDAYVSRVKGRHTALRNKKVRLLLLPDAAEMAEKYTALAETAWIAKLSQTLAGLHFGWKNGNDDEGRKRVTVVSGGLTARIRRKYKLNSLLTGDDVCEEDAEKNRSDKRHHALDAMVLAFIPGWARNESKQKWFRFPPPIDANPRGYFAGVISKVQPQNEHLAATRLEATAYGRRLLKREGESKESVFAVGREPLISLLLKVVSGKESLKPADKADTKRIVDDLIRKEVETFLASNPGVNLEQWKQWCSNYRINGSGPKVVKVLMTKTKAGGTDEYVDVSKDGTRQLRRGESHRGYFVFWAAAPTKKEPGKRRAVVKPVYAFQSVELVRRELRNMGIRDAHFYESGCTVELEAAVLHPKTPLVPGRYILNSIWEQGNVVVTSGSGKVSAPIGLAHMLNAGFKQAD